MSVTWWKRPQRTTLNKTSLEFTGGLITAPWHGKQAEPQGTSSCCRGCCCGGGRQDAPRSRCPQHSTAHHSTGHNTAQQSVANTGHSVAPGSCCAARWSSQTSRSAARAPAEGGDGSGMRSEPWLSVVYVFAAAHAGRRRGGVRMWGGMCVANLRPPPAGAPQALPTSNSTRLLPRPHWYAHVDDDVIALLLRPHDDALTPVHVAHNSPLELAGHGDLAVVGGWWWWWDGGPQPSQARQPGPPTPPPPQPPPTLHPHPRTSTFMMGSRMVGAALSYACLQARVGGRQPGLSSCQLGRAATQPSWHQSLPGQNSRQASLRVCHPGQKARARQQSKASKPEGRTRRSLEGKHAGQLEGQLARVDCVRRAIGQHHTHTLNRVPNQLASVDGLAEALSAREEGEGRASGHASQRCAASSLGSTAQRSPCVCCMCGERATRRTFSQAGTKLGGMALPTMPFSNSNLEPWCSAAVR